MPKVRVYFDHDVLPIVDNILEETGLKSYTDVVNYLVKKYGRDFIQSYNQFLSSPHATKPQMDVSSNIKLDNLESFRGL